MFSKVVFSNKRMLLVGLALGLLAVGGGVVTPDQAMGEPAAQVTSKVVLPETSEAGPVMKGFNGRTYIAWTGSGNLLLNVMSSNDGFNFTNKVTLPETAIGGVALAWFGNRLYIAWTGTDSEHHLNIMSSYDGMNFGNKVTLGDTSIAAPALEVFHGKLYIAWTGTDSEHRLNIMSSSDGVNFGSKITLGETSFTSPALAQEFAYRGVYSDMLFLAWTGTDRRLNSMVSLDGMAFGSKITVEEFSNAAPGLGSYSYGGLPLAWTGTDSRLNFVRYFGSSGKVTFNDTSIAAPALVTYYYDRYFIAWTGTDSEHHLNIGRIGE